MMYKMNDALMYYVTKANLLKIKDLMEVMPRSLEGKSLIDQSTVGLHLTGARRVNMEHAKIYAKILKIHPWRILDDYLCRYPVVGNLDTTTGLVTARGKFQNDYLCCSNDLEYCENTLVVLSKSCKIAYIYDESVYLNNENFNLEEPQRCIIETKNGEILAQVTEVNFENKKVQYFLSSGDDRFKLKNITYNKIRPINEILNLNTLSDKTAVIEHTFAEPKQYY